ncbi:MAG: glycosyltransferase [Pseudanabaena sp. M135S2SP2A07QC]|jgi:glycosyltransferase involved in cell wall biosynthesis|uniref:glycosyltransferase n=1 Tax=Microcystis sp. M158S2 TaxID=2771152 RepID=UPI00258889AB|nr:glycosyltransferase [Microcystis sp. M158S2]MCA6534568.1 glycosyltransferase [Pseudanabaena sp. M176S2SP2A07QC]MCA6537277.1 glycosyltransferase [Pseudanabaena sp. M037S2SP2A07QC]MCA6548953.1 glycosyltransferase [Pseudanabaena sp. M152S2SP2A07QC]MCA6553374.1 glycosyltransferase [Pseudanabaena sp. M135S2SP2A07QC]MCA6564882.1 glycosyltransferase [Pseudanabaena sp. M151S2SP2A07QC]MCA6571643.1 glycosyltransferase [Pseudanabaena sp. M065S1SP2A07QC]MCA6579759.1 glycosyltransferase [Pseudanabaena
MIILEKIGIVLATYNPNIEYFQKQIQSIKNQIHENWICHIVDDFSLIDLQKSIEIIIGDDTRFVCHFHNQNLNHYYNFERGLKYCIEDSSITAIALSDQDDIWHPQKLSILLAKLREKKAVLVHSDLKMIDSKDNVINQSTWEFEGRNPEKLSTDLLLLCNVVTGCSLIFCKSIVNDILPFPEQDKINWYHDWWIALVAAQKGRIEHIRQPLVMYRIHGLNNVGVTKDSSKIYREIMLLIKKKFKLSLNSYLVRKNFSNLFYQRFKKDLDIINWNNPFEDKRFDFGVRIIALLFTSISSGYNAEGVALRVWLLKILFDLQKIKQILINRQLKTTKRG